MRLKSPALRCARTRAVSGPVMTNDPAGAFVIDARLQVGVRSTLSFAKTNSRTASHGTPFTRMSDRCACRNLITGALVSVLGGGGGGAVTTDTDVAPLLVLPAASAQLTLIV